MREQILNVTLLLFLLRTSVFNHGRAGLQLRRNLQNEKLYLNDQNLLGMKLDDDH